MYGTPDNPILDHTFESALDAAIATLRSALRELNASVQADPLRPQVVSRRFGLNKNLTWKVMRILESKESPEAVSMLPGPSGIEIYLRAFEKAKASALHTAAVRAALANLDAVTRSHIGGRHELDTVLDGLRRDSQLEQSRRMAFRGLSGVFGVQAKLRLTAQIIAPAAVPNSTDLFDFFLVVGLIGLQRTRPVKGLPLFRVTKISSPLTQATDLQMQPLLPCDGTDSRQAWILREFTTIDASGVRAREEARNSLVELDAGPIGKGGAGDICFGARIDGAVTTHRTEGDARTEFATAIRVPSEAIVTDLFVPRAMRDAAQAEAALYGILSGPLPQDPTDREKARLPITTNITWHDVNDEALALDAFPRYGELVRTTFAVAKHDPREFVCMRVQLDYPPCPSEIIVGWDLSE